MTTAKKNTPPPPAATYDIIGLTEDQALKLHALLSIVHTGAGLGDVWDALDDWLPGLTGRDRFTIQAADDEHAEIPDVSILRILDNIVE